jgi:DNA-directed RNA polymerase subunit RPC12/RpoP
METVNIIQCPHCGNTIEPWDFLDVGDMEGSFTMECEGCKKEFSVEFKTEIRFITTK